MLHGLDVAAVLVAGQGLRALHGCRKVLQREEMLISVKLEYMYLNSVASIQPLGLMRLRVDASSGASSPEQPV